jgi:4-amino-4-deoxy-L-arabinose transferase-like glycosyltransferase
MIDIFEIVKKIKSMWTKKDVLIMFSLLLAFLVTRITNLTKLLIFTDEAIYIHWAHLAWKDAAWRFVSLTDGRQPLQTWATIPLLKLFSDPLFAGRMFGVMSGLFAVIGIFILLYYLFGKKYAFIGTFIYIINPYYLFYERMALADAAVNGFFIWTLLCSMLLIKNRRLDLAIAFGFIAGFGTLSKSTMRIFFIFPLFAPLLFYFREKNYVKKCINYYFLFAITACIAFAIYNIQRLSPYMHFIEQKNLAFTKSFSDFIKNPFDPLIHNLRTIPYYSFSESAFLLPVLGLAGLFVMLVRDQETAITVRGRVTVFFKKLLKVIGIVSDQCSINGFNPMMLALYLYIALLIPFFAVATFGNVVFPRYLIFLTVPLFIGFIYLLKETQSKVLIILYILSVFYFNYCIIFTPQNIPFPPIDRGQYLEGNSVGYGMSNIRDFIVEKAKSGQNVYIFTEGTFGLLPYAFDIYTNYKGLLVHYEPRWPMKDEDITYALNLTQSNQVYLVFSERETFPSTWPLRLIQRFPRPGDNKVVYLFGLKKQ